MEKQMENPVETGTLNPKPWWLAGMRSGRISWSALVSAYGAFFFFFFFFFFFRECSRTQGLGFRV